jgi:hypothetical protein
MADLLVGAVHENSPDIVAEYTIGNIHPTAEITQDAVAGAVGQV